MIAKDFAQQLFNLQDRVAFVTGAGSGIGQMIAYGLASAGLGSSASISVKMAASPKPSKILKPSAERPATTPVMCASLATYAPAWH